MLNRVFFILLLCFQSLAAFSEGFEENFEISVPTSGAVVESPLPFSELKGSFIKVPRGAIRKRTDFSITSQFSHCPKLPKKLVDVAPPMGFGPEGQKFLQKLTVRIAIPETYTTRLAVKTKTIKRGKAKNYQVWAHHKNGWKRIKSHSIHADSIEFLASVFDGQCYTATINQ